MTNSTGGRPLRSLLVDAAASAAAATRRASVGIRQLETLEQMQLACAVLDRVWEIPPGQTSEIQPHLLRALGHGGNYLVGAYEPGGSMVGASVAFFTEPLGSAMHSHITGVLPGATGRGIGAAIKWHQRQWAMERGLTKITWTFDPLIARNSFFNLTRLGARPETYFVDFYGVLHDGPNRGQPTDRMQVGWDLSAVSTLEAQAAVLDHGPVGQHTGPGSTADDGPDVSSWMRAAALTLLSEGAAGEPVRGAVAGPEVILAVIGIPRDIERIRRTDPSLALSWRYALRSTLALVMADSSWKVTGFARAGWYLLRRATSGAADGGGRG
jgi:predicted GNAT superfamily acetyltransferase